MKKKIQNPFADDNCFFCGRNNDSGLKLEFSWDDKKKEASTEYLPLQHFSGQGNILHGGIQMGILDEIMGWTSYMYTKKMSVTSDLSLKFSHPAYIDGEKIKAVCRVLSKDGPRVNMQAVLSDFTGVVCTTATGTYHILSSDKYSALLYGRQKGKRAGQTSDPLKKELEWIAGPDLDMNWYEACEWVKNLKITDGGWRMPSIKELKELYNQNSFTPVNIYPSFETTGWWLWSGEEEGLLSALGFDIDRGKVVSGGRSLVSGGRVFAVRTLK